jgi:pimeloyl-ACP methyl ester carboxylesterase
MINFFSDKGYQVFVPQLPIYDLPILNTNLTSISKFVAKFIKDVIGKPVTIVGNSMGGHIGLILTTTRPELVRNLVLTGSSGLYERTSFPRKSDKDYIKRKPRMFFMIRLLRLTNW